GVLLDRVEQRRRLQPVARRARTRLLDDAPLVDRLLHRRDHEPLAELGDTPVAELDRFREIVPGVDVHDRERELARPERLLGVATKTSTNGACCSTSERAWRRISSYGEMAETTTTAPARARREATQPMRAMFVSRSSFEKPRPFERCVRTMSPSRWSTTKPRRSSSGSTLFAIV